MYLRNKCAARILVLVLAVTTVLAFTPFLGWSQDIHAASSPIIITSSGAPLNITDAGYWKWNGTGYAASTSGDYNIHYDSTESSLELKDDDHFTSVTVGGPLKIILNNADINSQNGTAINTGNLSGVQFELDLKGKNHITSSPVNASDSGIEAAVVDIVGTGSLDVRSGGSAITADTLILNGAAVTADSFLSYTIDCSNFSMISGSMAATAEAADKVAIAADRLDVHGGTIIAKATGTGGLAIANSPVGSITVQGGAIYAYGAEKAIQSSAATIGSAELSTEDSENNYYKYITTLTDSKGKAVLAYASTTNRPIGKISVGGLELVSNQSGADLSANTYGDFNDTAPNGVRAWSWSVNKTLSGYNLALNNANITSEKVDCSEDLEVTLSGKNIIDLSDFTVGSNDYEEYALSCDKSITFSGSGSLEATSNTGTDFCRGIAAADGNLTVNGPEITGNGGSDSPDSIGVMVGGKIIVKSGSVTGKGKAASSTSGAASSIGIAAANGIDASGGKVARYGETASTTASGKQSTSVGVVLTEMDPVTVLGTVTGKAGTADNSFGVASSGEPATVSGSSVITAESANNTAFNKALLIGNNIIATLEAGNQADGVGAAVVSNPTDATYTGNKFVRITAAKLPEIYNVTWNVTSGTGRGTTEKATEGTEYNGMITPDSGKVFPENITVTVGGNAITDFTYKDGAVTIPAKYVKGAIVITAVCKDAPIKSNVTGAVLTVSKLKYKVTKAAGSGAAGTVMLVKPLKKTNKTISVPSTVKVSGYIYRVTAIPAGAFSKNTKLTSVVIGKYVRTIGKNAFYKCKKLKTVKFAGKYVTKINKGAFKTCAKNCSFKLPKSKYNTYKKLLKKSGVPKGAKYKKY